MVSDELLTDKSPLRRETNRQAVHMLAGMFALLLRWLSYHQALACAVAAIVFNAFILPRLPGSKRRLYRPDERERGFSTGILMYPISVFLLILAFPVPVAAAMWGVLSFGDGLATIVGTGAEVSHLPWNRDKSFDGMVAFLVGATPVAAFLYWWAAPNMISSPPWWSSLDAQARFGSLGIERMLIISMITAVVCAFLETLKLWLDDNLVVPLAGAWAMVGLVYAFTG